MTAERLTAAEEREQECLKYLLIILDDVEADHRWATNYRDAVAARVEARQLQLVTNATIGWHEAEERAKAAEGREGALLAAAATLRTALQAFDAIVREPEMSYDRELRQVRAEAAVWDAANAVAAVEGRAALTYEEWDLRVYQEAEARGLIPYAPLSALRAEMPFTSAPPQPEEAHDA